MDHLPRANHGQGAHGNPWCVLQPLPGCIPSTSGRRPTGYRHSAEKDVRSSNPVASATDQQERERLLRMLAAVTFLIFFQAYMVAPIIPALSQAFGTSVQTVAL